MAFLILKRLRKPKRPKHVYIIPFIFTFLNAFFGLLSVLYTIEHNYIMAAYCILSAVCMDFWDGRLARALNTCSSLGMELDSLCDAISFCFAPAILMYSWHVHQIGILGLIAVCLYLCSGLFRLAKFNAQNMNQNNYFIGLPTTFAACFIALFVLLAVWFEVSTHNALSSSLGVLLILSYLMPSSMRFPSLKQIRMSSFYRS